MKLTAQQILDELAKCGDPNYRWVCRDSTTGRGLRLHQCSSDSDGIHPLNGDPTFATPEAAIRYFLGETD